MAIAINTGGITGPINMNRCLEYIVKCTLSGSYATGGEALSTLLKVSQITSDRTPIWVHAQDLSGYTYGWDSVNNKLLVYLAGSGSAAPAELAAASYPAALATPNVVILRVTMPKLV